MNIAVGAHFLRGKCSPHILFLVQFIKKGKPLIIRLIKKIASILRLKFLKFVFYLAGLEYMSKNNAQKIPTRRIEFLVLGGGILLVLSIHLNAIISSYGVVQDIKSENPSGSTLAERYLILGDWPASRANKPTDFTSNYKIISSSEGRDASKAEQ